MERRVSETGRIHVGTSSSSRREPVFCLELLPAPVAPQSRRALCQALSLDVVEAFEKWRLAGSRGGDNLG